MIVLSIACISMVLFYLKKVRLDAYLKRAFERWAGVVYEWQWLCIVVPVVITLGLGSGLLLVREQTLRNPVRLLRAFWGS